MEVEEKNTMSHRGLAMVEFLKRLPNALDG
jgi:inosine/xanthosine triphosphate pyrophosphatase family protein